MACTIFYFLVSILLATNVFLLPSSPTATIKYPSVCERAPDKDLCTKLVKDATDWPTAMTNAINAGLIMVKSGKPVVDSIVNNLPSNLQPVTVKLLNSLCYEDYNSMVNYMEESLNLIREDTLDSSYSIQNNLCTTNMMALCIGRLEKFNVTLPDVTKYNSEMENLFSILCHVADYKKIVNFINAAEGEKQEYVLHTDEPDIDYVVG